MSLSRRNLLAGLFRRKADASGESPANGDTPSSAPPAFRREPGSVDPAKVPLPRVIAWLADYSDDAVGPVPAVGKARRALPPLLRPPGAVAEADFLTRCTSCADCVSACPHNAIVPAPAQFRAAAGTPSIDPSVAPCRMCEDFPCITACGEGALVTNADVMGRAIVRRFDCLNELGTACSICVEQCPVEGAMSWRGAASAARRVPSVAESLCTGCGVCHFACPAPVNAIAILPNAARRSVAVPSLNTDKK